MKTLIDAIKEIESKDFRTIDDTGANPAAMLILNRLRNMAFLPVISERDLPIYSNGKYRMPKDSNLLANTKPKIDPWVSSHANRFPPCR